MKERPILFSAPMVRELLDGSKTQTRRVVKPAKCKTMGVPLACCEIAGEINQGDYTNSPYGQPGDRLWVRENGWERPERTPRMMREGADTWEPYYFDADGLSEDEAADFKAWGFKRRPSIHMPRWASRITLEVTGVRVERLQDISEADALAEGAAWAACGSPQEGSHKAGFAGLWESINGDGSWGTNPWVWVVEFKRVVQA